MLSYVNISNPKVNQCKKLVETYGKVLVTSGCTDYAKKLIYLNITCEISSVTSTVDGTLNIKPNEPMSKKQDIRQN